MVENKYILYFCILLSLSSYNIISVYLITLHYNLSWTYLKKENWKTYDNDGHFSAEWLNLNIHSSEMILDKL